MRSLRSALVCLLLLLSCVGLGFGKNKRPLATVHVTVTKSYNGKAVRSAAVILHMVNADGGQSSEGYEVKTDGEGHATIDDVPYGRVRLQIIAQGLQTYGQDFDVQEPARTIEVKLDAPKGQYSIYK